MHGVAGDCFAEPSLVHKRVADLMQELVLATGANKQEQGAIEQASSAASENMIKSPY